MALLRRLKLKQRFLSILILVVTLLFTSFGSIVYFNRVSGTTETVDTVMIGNLLDLRTVIDLAAKKNTLKQNLLNQTVNDISSEIDFQVPYEYQENLYIPRPSIALTHGLTNEDWQYLNQSLPYKKYYATGYGFIINHEGKVLAHVDETITDVSEAYFFDKLVHDFAGKIVWDNPDNGDREWLYYLNYAERDIFILAAIKEADVLTAPVRKTMTLAISSMSFALFIFVLLTNGLANSVINPVKKINRALKKIAVGELDETVVLKNKDEIHEIALSVNHITSTLKKTSNFAREIGQGNFNSEFQPLSENDELGKALLEMRESLKTAQETEKVRKAEDSKRNWATEGLAKFADILRQDNDNIQKLSYNIISNMVNYLNANQGGLFLLNEDKEDDRFLEMQACYAYERKKFIEKRFELDEGLIGASYMEKNTISLKEFPDDYISITSGLGEAVPNALLLVPLNVNEQCFGVMEVASFDEFQDYEIQFVEKVAESIAATIASVKTNTRTAKLLEQSQQQQEEMQAHEEEMRQNMEELHATQEEMERKSLEMEGIMTALNTSNYIIIYDLNGKVLSINDPYLKLLGISSKEVIGTHHKDNLDLAANPEGYKKFWDDLRQGVVRIEENKVSLKGKEYWMKETYGPILDRNGIPYKIFKVAQDMTESKKQKLLLDEQEGRIRKTFSDLEEAKKEVLRQKAEMEGYYIAINNAVPCLEYDLNGKIVRINDAYMDYAQRFGEITREQILGKYHTDFLVPTEYGYSEEYKKFWIALTEGKSQTIESEKDIKGTQVYTREIYTPVKDQDGKVFKIIRFSYDITEQKKMQAKISKLEKDIKGNQK